ncbi:daunorubicin/doxorubicin resistance ATP-binding protein DrrA [Candidatus Phycosocius bacilliformis]|uniref:Daunorubicin/doxorubicin resistance ATP-binding protein DrrA n=1 Tax=Candidatus Phycosocius bacilliformis TaxID=1445552 RepID=A0A2P2EDP8_9PROT|nr:ABC transporter ATP-binding protein [Candidatus Phycosocius bacilliformis]GBF59192.1 daunorubicin/doxorubicin resistance ATP-binding protein DrrA [Candidatus Phycosocius bacilliformis]
MSQTPYAIEARGLQKIYAASGKSPEKHALKGLDLAIPKGSIFGLLGPNGAGKSTFINILAGLVIKTSGVVRIWDTDIDKDHRAAKAAIGIVPQEISFDAFFTPFETLELQAGFYGVPPKERRSMELLEAVGLADKRDTYSRLLSGGMKRRLLIAKALVHNPPVVILDEPTAGVDVELRRSLWDYVTMLNKERGVTIVLTTHYLEEAQELCDNIAIIDQGQLIACEPTAKLLTRLDRKAVVITPVEALKQIPAGLNGLDTVLRPDGSLAIHYRPKEQSVEALLTQAMGSGVQIRDLRIEEPNLEDVFVSLTSPAGGR